MPTVHPGIQEPITTMRFETRSFSHQNTKDKKNRRDEGK